MYALLPFTINQDPSVDCGPYWLRPPAMLCIAMRAGFENNQYMSFEHILIGVKLSNCLLFSSLADARRSERKRGVKKLKTAVRRIQTEIFIYCLRRSEMIICKFSFPSLSSAIKTIEPLSAFKFKSSFISIH